MSYVIYSDGTILPFCPIKLKQSLMKVAVPSSAIDNILNKVMWALPSTINVDALIDLTAQTIMKMSVIDSEHAQAAGRFYIQIIYKKAPNNLYDSAVCLLEVGLIKWTDFDFITEHLDKLESTIDHKMDHHFDYAGLKCYQRLKQGICIRPQYNKMIQSIKYYKHTGLEDVLKWYKIFSSLGLKCLRVGKQTLCTENEGCSVCTAVAIPNIEIEHFMEFQRNQFIQNHGDLRLKRK